MNGETLPPEHGYPVRLLAPGWYGMASVKWLANIRVLEQPFRGFHENDYYVYVAEGADDSTGLVSPDGGDQEADVPTLHPPDPPGQG